MATSTKDADVTPAAPLPNGVAHGYLPSARPRYRWVEFDPSAETDAIEDAPRPEDMPGLGTFRAEIRSNLTWGEIAELASVRLFADIQAQMAPYVRNWNVLARDAVTGELVAAPSPAEAGPDAFKMIDAETGLWLWTTLQLAYQGGDERKKGSPAPEPSPEKPSDDASA